MRHFLKNFEEKEKRLNKQFQAYAILGNLI